MFRRLSTIAVFALAGCCTSPLAHAQFGGVQMQVGGYGNGIRIGGYGNGNGYYNYGYGYRNGYGNRFYGGESFYGGYNNGLPYTGLYPNFGYSYAPPVYYSAPFRSYPIRRYRYR